MNPWSVDSRLSETTNKRILYALCVQSWLRRRKRFDLVSGLVDLNVYRPLFWLCEWDLGPCKKCNNGWIETVIPSDKSASLPQPYPDTYVYLALNTLFSNQLYVKYKPTGNSSQFHGWHTARCKWNVALLYRALYILCGVSWNIFYIVWERWLFSAFDLWNWLRRFTLPYLAARFVYVCAVFHSKGSCMENTSSCDIQGASQYMPGRRLRPVPVFS
jgi:hypothetical protein